MRTLYVIGVPGARGSGGDVVDPEGSRYASAMTRPRRPLTPGALLRRAAGMVAGYFVHGSLLHWLGMLDRVPLTAPSGLLMTLLPFGGAALVAGYLATLVSGGSARTARLLGIALAAIAILAALQRLEQGLPLLTRQVAQIVTSPLCVAGGVLLERHLALWQRRTS